MWGRTTWQECVTEEGSSGHHSQEGDRERGESTLLTQKAHLHWLMSSSNTLPVYTYCRVNLLKCINPLAGYNSWSVISPLNSLHCLTHEPLGDITYSTLAGPQHVFSAVMEEIMVKKTEHAQDSNYSLSSVDHSYSYFHGCHSDSFWQLYFVFRGGLCIGTFYTSSLIHISWNPNSH